MNNDYDERQKNLVEFSERVYEAGFKHRSLSGTLCEDAMLKFLQQDVREFKFYKGQIGLGKHNNKVSSQYDIIICDKDFKPGHNKLISSVSTLVAIVPKESVHGVIEVKKWTHPKMVEKDGVLNKQIMRFKEEAGELPYFFVTYRFHDRKKDTSQRWAQLKKTMSTNRAYCLFGPASRSGQGYLYPWEEKDCSGKKIFDNFSSRCVYAGEYEKLIKDIKFLCKGI